MKNIYEQYTNIQVLISGLTLRTGLEMLNTLQNKRSWTHNVECRATPTHGVFKFKKSKIQYISSVELSRAPLRGCRATN